MLRGLEAESPPSECEEEGAWMRPVGDGAGPEEANRMFATGGQSPSLP